MPDNQVKLILNKARQEDIAKCTKIIQQALKEFNCTFLGTITVKQGTSVIIVKAMGSNLKLDVVPLMEE